MSDRENEIGRTTFEAAKICPKCKRPGEDRGERQAPGLPRGTMIHTIYCTTELCPWFDTPWYVQVDPDGSVPPPRNHTGEKKHYQGFEDHDVIAKQVLDSLKNQNKMETEPGTEIRNPRG